MTRCDLHDLTLDDPAAANLLEQMGRISAASQLVEVGFTDLAGTAATYRARLETPYAGRTRYLLALEPGTTRVLAFAAAVMPVTDNTSLAYVSIVVDPPERRRGVGSVLAEHLLRLVRAHGRTKLSAFTDHPPGDLNPADASAVFATGLGAAIAQIEERTTLGLTPALRAALPARGRAAAARVRARGGRFSLVQWVGASPQDLLADLCRMYEQMSIDIPQGELDVEADVWSPERIRANEHNLAAGGRTVVQTVARDASGELAGYTILHASPRGYATQEDTFVRASSRGMHLGTRLKYANLELLLAHFPGTERVHTWNATENGPMLAINRALGFEPSGIDVAWQLRLS